MSGQKELFDLVVNKPMADYAVPFMPLPQPRARRTDPDTSHEAARRVERTGKAERDRRAIIRYLQQRTERGLSPQTSAEIANIIGMDRHTAARRLPELKPRGIEKAGERICMVNGTPAVTWRAV